MLRRITVKYEAQLDFTDKLIGEIRSKCIELGGSNLKVETESMFRKKVKIGMAAAKARGEKLGAPKGNKNRVGKRKSYSSEEISELKELLDQGLNYRQIKKEISFPISLGKISYLKKIIYDEE